MKKAQMALVAALCVAGFAQAAEVDWNLVGKYTTTTAAGQMVTLGDGQGSAPSSTYTFAAIVSNVTFTGTDGTLLAVNASSKNTGDNPKVFLKLRKDGDALTVRYQTNNDYEDFPAGTNVAFNANQENAIAFTIERSASGATITWYLNGVELGDHTYDMNNSDTLDRIVFGQDFNGGNDFGADWELYTYAGVVNPEDVTVDAMRGEPLPEPTALALLALGVAGIALRRKVA